MRSRQARVEFGRLVVRGGRLLPLALVEMNVSEIAVSRRPSLGSSSMALRYSAAASPPSALAVQGIAEGFVRPASLGSSSMALRYSAVASCRFPCSRRALAEAIVRGGVFRVEFDGGTVLGGRLLPVCPGRIGRCRGRYGRKHIWDRVQTPCGIRPRPRLTCVVRGGRYQNWDAGANLGSSSTALRNSAVASSRLF